MLCVASSDGLVSVIDRNVFLLENPQTRSSAFRFSVGNEQSPRSGSPTFSVSSFTTQQETSGRTTPTDQSDIFSQSQSEARSRPSSTRPWKRSSSYCVAPLGKSSRSLFRHSESLFSGYVDRSATATPELKSLSRSSSRSSLTSETFVTTDPTIAVPRRSSVYTSGTSSNSFQTVEKPPSIVGSVLGVFSGASQSAGASAALVHAQTMPQLRDQSAYAGRMEAACCWFHIPKWEVTSQFRQMTFLGSVLYIWLQQSSSTGSGSGDLADTVIVLNLSSYEILSFT